MHSEIREIPRIERGTRENMGNEGQSNSTGGRITLKYCGKPSIPKTSGRELGVENNSYHSQRVRKELYTHIYEGP